MNEKDTAVAYFKAQAKHGRQLKRLQGKIVAKWTDRDFAAVQATRAARDSAVAALTFEQRLAFVDGLTKAEIERRLTELRAQARRAEQVDGAAHV